jgi:hypothetical protein
MYNDGPCSPVLNATLVTRVLCLILYYKIESFSQNGKPESARYLFAMTHTSFTVVNS